MSNAIEQLATEAGFTNPTGAILLQGDQNRRGIVRGFLQHGEHACEVDVDLSRLDEREAILRSRRGASYVFTPAFYEAAQYLIGFLLDTQSDLTRLNLFRLLGEEGADRFLEQMGLSEPEPDVGVLEKVAPASDGEPMKQ